VRYDGNLKLNEALGSPSRKSDFSGQKVVFRTNSPKRVDQVLTGYIPMMAGIPPLRLSCPPACKAVGGEGGRWRAPLPSFEGANHGRLSQRGSAQHLIVCKHRAVTVLRRNANSTN
jgi:hypothetical protein